jgi:hypothetical protein
MCILGIKKWFSVISGTTEHIRRPQNILGDHRTYLATPEEQKEQTEQTEPTEQTEQTEHQKS